MKIGPLRYAVLVCLAIGITVAQEPPNRTNLLGVVEAVDPGNGQINLRTDDGKAVKLVLHTTARLLRLPPGDDRLANATPIPIKDIEVGDRIIARGELADDKTAMAVSTLVIMVKTDITINIEHLMTAQELNQTGVATLSSRQKEALNRWLNGYTQRILSTVRTPKQERATGDAGHSTTYAQTTEPQLELVTYRWHSEHDFAILEGQVTNISSRSLEGVVAVATYYDADGGFLTSEETLIAYNPILPGQTSPFRVYTTLQEAMKDAKVDFKYFGGGSIPFRSR